MDRKCTQFRNWRQLYSNQLIILIDRDDFSRTEASMLLTCLCETYTPYALWAAEYPQAFTYLPFIQYAHGTASLVCSTHRAPHLTTRQQTKIMMNKNEFNYYVTVSVNKVSMYSFPRNALRCLWGDDIHARGRFILRDKYIMMGSLFLGFFYRRSV